MGFGGESAIRTAPDVVTGQILGLVVQARAQLREGGASASARQDSVDTYAVTSSVCEWLCLRLGRTK